MSQYNKIFENSLFIKETEEQIRYFSSAVNNLIDSQFLEEATEQIRYFSSAVNNFIDSQFLEEATEQIRYFSSTVSNLIDSQFLEEAAEQIRYFSSAVSNLIDSQFLEEAAEQIRYFSSTVSNLIDSQFLEEAAKQTGYFSTINNIIKDDLIFTDKIINSENYNLDNIISKYNNIEEFDKEKFITIFIYEVIKIGEYFNSGLKRIGKNIGDIADIVTILSFILGFIHNFQSNNECSNNIITYNYNISINNYNISTDSYLTNLEIGFTNKDTMLYSRSNESLEEIAPLCSGLKVKIINKYNEWIQIEVNPDGIILKGWVRSDDINILK